MLHVASWTETLPMMISGMLGIILVMGIIVLLVMALNKLTSRKERERVSGARRGLGRPLLAPRLAT